MQFGIKGDLVPAGSTDATLSNLEIYASASALATLSPTFDSEVTEYTTTVANEHTSANIEATRNDANATIEFLDKDDTTIPILGITNQNSWIIPNLDVGDNIFKIKVTAEDTTTTKTYQVTITRASEPDTIPPTLVSATVETRGTTIALTFSEVYVWPSTPEDRVPFLNTLNSAFDITIDGVSATTRLLSSGQEPALKIVRVLIDSAMVRQGQAVVVTYTDPTAGDDTVAIQDAAGNDVETFTTGADGVPAVVNSSTVAKSAPDAPTGLNTTTGGTGEINLTWVAPADNGGEPITKYQYRVSADSGTTWNPDWTDVPDSNSDSDQADERSVSITSLTPGTLHTFQVRAVNTEGDGTAAATTATPAAGPAAPPAPASLSASAGDAQATLTWTAPTSDGGAAITKYQYRVSVDDGTTWSPDWTDVPDGPDSGLRPGRRAGP